MKNFLNKAISLLLVVALFSTVGITFQASSSESSEAKSRVDIQVDKNRYNWGDTILFSVAITNLNESDLDQVTISLTPEYETFFTVSESSITISNITQNSSKAAQISATSNAGLFSRIFMLLIKLFRIGINPSFSGKQFDAVQTIKVGVFSYKFGFNVAYGSDSTTAERELENIMDLNGGDLPDIYMDTEDRIPSFIDGSFSNKNVRNESDALAALNDIKHLMTIDDIENEFSFYQKDAYDGSTFYRFQQLYKGIEVYAKNLVIAVDGKNKTSALSNDYEPNINVNITPKISERAAIRAAESFIHDANGTTSQGLCIYCINTEPTLAYKIYCSGLYEDSLFSGIVFVDALSGNVVATNNSTYYENIQTSRSFNGVSYSFNVWHDNTEYKLFDASRNIVVFNLNRAVADYSTLNTPVISSKMVDKNGNQYSVISNNRLQDFTDQAEIVVYHNLTKAYDYYLTSFGRKSFDGKGSPVFLTVNSQFKSKSGNIYGRNAYSYSGYGNHTDIVYGADYDPLALDVVVHEYTHSVESTISGMKYSAESGALMEAYSDVMGEIVEKDTSWMHFTNRNLANPAASGKPSQYKGTNWASTTGDDYGGVHTNGTVIAHAAYLMQKDKITNMQRLGELWYRSLYFLDRNSSFADCRASVIAAARDMKMSDAEINCIRSAFDAVHVFGPKTDQWSYTYTSGTLTISGTGDMEDYRSFNQTPWSAYKENIRKVIVETGITKIGDYAFAQCSNLTEIVIPNTVTQIGTSSFYECNLLQSVTLPASVRRVGDYAFYNCYTMHTLALGSIETIGIYAFAQCDTLTSVNIPNTAKSIGDSAFAWCDTLNTVTFRSAACTIYDSANTIPSDTVICGAAGSTAEQYAAKYNRTFLTL